MIRFSTVVVSPIVSKIHCFWRCALGWQRGEVTISTLGGGGDAVVMPVYFSVCRVVPRPFSCAVVCNVVARPAGRSGVLVGWSVPRVLDMRFTQFTTLPQLW